VFRPPIYCAAKRTRLLSRNVKYITKIARVHAADYEIKQAKPFHKVDPSYEFHIGSQEMCKPSKMQAAKLVRMCGEKLDKMNGKTAEDVRLMYQEDGGTDVEKYMASHNSKRDVDWINNTFLQGMRHLAKGLYTFNRNSIFHQDIKPANVVINGSKCRLIDLGASGRMWQLFKKDKLKDFMYNHETVFNHHYLAPPECCFFALPLYKNTEHDYRHAMTYIDKLAKKKTPLFIKDLTSDHVLYGVQDSFMNRFMDHPRQSITHVYNAGIYSKNDYINAIRKIKMDNVLVSEIYEALVKSIDSFAFGLMVVWACNHVVMSDTCRTWLKKVLHPNPLLRLAGSEAYIEFTQLTKKQTFVNPRDQLYHNMRQIRVYHKY